MSEQIKELTEVSAGWLAKAIKNKEVSSVEVVRAHIDRIALVNPRINALIQMADIDDLIKQAQLADKAVSQGKSLGILHGVPVTVKDALKVQGFICSAGCAGLHGKKSAVDATLVGRLRQAGAIILGLTNVPELLVYPETDNLLYGRTNNPYDLNRTAGGSSGGEAAIIAAGGSPFGLASDAGGSIRIPSHCCGIAGYKPTHGLFPSTGSTLGDAPGIFGDIVTFGTMSRYVEDLILTLSLLVGPDEYDPRTVPVSIADPKKVDLSRLRIAYYFDNGISQPTKETVAAVKSAVQALSKNSASVEERRPPSLKLHEKLLLETIFYGGDEGEGLSRWLKLIGNHKQSPFLQEFLKEAKKCRFSVTEMRRRLVEIDQFRNEMMRFMIDYDLVICPAMATPARQHGMGFAKSEEFYTMGYNLTGAPVVVVRGGTSPENLPIGLQVAAKPWHDDIALAAAAYLEKNLGGWKSPSL